MPEDNEESEFADDAYYVDDDDDSDDNSGSGAKFAALAGVSALVGGAAVWGANKLRRRWKLVRNTDAADDDQKVVELVKKDLESDDDGSNPKE